ncbi:hypothetical protein MKX03_034846 [Papaver bracteatum]|nr:hypothetical protein MKX03_034846 [Papaver bracteatum]
MASFSSSSVCTAVFLLLSIFLVSASTDNENIEVVYVSPSLEVGSVTESNICDPEDVSRDEVWGPTQDCNICTFYCTGVCAGMGSQTVKKACTPRKRASQIVCQCCCTKPPSPPLPPPSPPPPTPSFDEKCVKQGDNPYNTTRPTPDCAECTDWCKEQCSKKGGYMVDEKCAKPGESDWLRRCNCCCRDNSKPPSPPSCPTLGCPSEATWTIPGVKPCNYRLVSSSSSSSSSISM